MALAYTAPTWTDGSGEGLSASNLQAISNCIEGLVQGSDKAIHNIAINNGVMTITYVDGTIDTDIAVDMKGISNIAKTSTVGNVDTYTVTYTDGSTFTFTVTNGRDDAIQYTEGTNIHIDNDNVISTYNVFAQDDPDVSDMNDTDLMPLSRNAYTKVITWSNIKAKLKSYFDGLYLGGTYKTTTTKSSSSGTDTFTLTDASITSNTVVYGVVCDKPMVNYTGITVSTGQIQITYNTSDAVGTVGVVLR